MKISELKPGQGNVDVEGVVKEIGEVRTFNKFGRELSVANAVLEDDSGSIKLTLWNDDVARFKEGDKIKITNGYVNEFQGESQLTSGKYGSIEKVEGSGESESGDEGSDKSESGDEGSDKSESGAGEVSEGEASEASENSTEAPAEPASEPVAEPAEEVSEMEGEETPKEEVL